MSPMTNIKSSKTSLQNALFLLLFVIGMFMMYRYVKSIETDVKMLQNHFIELNEKINNIPSLNSTEDVNGTCAKEIAESKPRSLGGKHAKKPHSEKHENDGDDDDQSVKSEDITNILRKVIGNDDDDINDHDYEHAMTAQINIMNHMLSNVMNPVQHAKATDHSTCIVTELFDEDDTSAKQKKTVINIDGEDIEDGDNQTANDEDDERCGSDEGEKKCYESYDKIELMKKTNDELKSMLKDRSLSIKGAKNELVDRLLSS